MSFPRQLQARYRHRHFTRPHAPWSWLGRSRFNPIDPRPILRWPQAKRLSKAIGGGRALSPLERQLHDAPESTSLELVSIVACPARLQLLVRLLTEGPMDVTQLSLRCRQSESLVSSHLKALRRLGLCGYDIEGRHHVYRITNHNSVRIVEGGLEFNLAAGDGSKLSLQVPATSPVIRLLKPPVTRPVKFETGVGSKSSTRASPAVMSFLYVLATCCDTPLNAV